jgi:hypothetical protein
VEQNPVIQVTCRDGIPARVQRVPYEGTNGGEVYMGKRNPPDMKPFDADGMANESGDIWNLEGFWRTDRTPHPFDIVKVITSQPFLESAHAQ